MAGSQGGAALGHGTATRDGLEVGIKAEVRVHIRAGVDSSFSVRIVDTVGVRRRGRVKTRDAISIRVGLGSGSGSWSNHQLTQNQEEKPKSSIPGPSISAQSCPQLPLAPSPSWGN